MNSSEKEAEAAHNQVMITVLYVWNPEKAMAPHSSVLAWRIPGTGEPDGLPSMGSHRVGHDWSNLAAAAAACVKSPTRWLSQRRALSREFGGTNESPSTNMIVLRTAILPKVVLSFSWFRNKENDALYKSSYSLWICLVYRLLLFSR